MQSTDLRSLVRGMPVTRYALHHLFGPAFPVIKVPLHGRLPAGGGDWVTIGARRRINRHQIPIRRYGMADKEHDSTQRYRQRGD